MRSRGVWLAAYVWLFFIFVVAPIAVVVVVSFTSATYVGFPIEGVSLRWFVRVFTYEAFRNALLVSFETALLSSLLAALLGVPAALALSRRRHGWAPALLVFLLSPLSIPFLVLGFAMLFYASAFGLGGSLAALVVAHTVVGLPYVVRSVAAVHRGLAPGLEETAMVLGAGRWQVFRHVTLPLIRPGLFAGLVFAALISLDNLSLSYFLAGPTTTTLPVAMLSYLEYQFDPSVAALSTVQLAIAVIGLLAVQRSFGLGELTPPA